MEEVEHRTDQDITKQREQQKEKWEIPRAEEGEGRWRRTNKESG